MIAKNFEFKKPLITETNLHQNQTDRDYQLWQETFNFCVREPTAICCASRFEERRA